jgi:methoxymalonate biosynthesis acyl carrier protein
MISDPAASPDARRSNDEAPTKMLDAGLTSRIAAFISRSFEGRMVAPDDDIFALGFANSLFAMQLVAFVEKEFRIDIDSEDLEMDNFRSVDAISALVERKLSATAER